MAYGSGSNNGNMKMRKQAEKEAPHQQLRKRPIQFVSVVAGAVLTLLNFLSPLIGASIGDSIDHSIQPSIDSSLASSSDSSRKIISNGSTHHPRIVLLSDDTSLQSTQQMKVFALGTENFSETIVIEESKLPMNDSQYEEHRFISEVETTGCPFIADWQSVRDSRPTCNRIHEIGMQIVSDHVEELAVGRIAHGYIKDAWYIVANGEILSDAKLGVLKTQMYRRDFTATDFDDHIRDAIVMNQASSSPYVLDMYSYCGSTHLVESAPTTLVDWLEEGGNRISSLDKLRVATQIATGLRDAHLLHNGSATVAHADIKPKQFLLPAGSNTFKLNDFNFCHLLTSKQGVVCPFKIRSKKVWKSYNRAPETYPEEYLIGLKPYSGKTDKVDIVALGSVFFYILTGYGPFTEDDLHFRQVVNKIVTGVQPPLPAHIATSKDPNILAIIHAMNWARALKPNDRPTSQQLASHLTKQLSTAAVYR